MNFGVKNEVFTRNEIVAIFLLGLSGYLLFLSRFFLPISTILIFSALALHVRTLVALAKNVSHQLPTLRVQNKFLILVIATFVLSNAVGIFLPETGFDAVWYHLPITQVFINTKANVFIPELYQSAMPRLGSMMFVVPYVLGKELGVKVYVYLLSLCIPVLVYRLARVWLSKDFALLSTAMLWSFHTVAWQASSAYVDQIRFVFELAFFTGVFTLLRTKAKNQWFLLGFFGVLLGFSLSTKLLSVFFLPAFFMFAWKKFGLKKALLVIGVALLTVAPWYIQSFRWTGNPVYPLFQQLDGKQQLIEMGINNWPSWILANIVKLLFAPVFLSVHRESAMTSVFLFSFPFLLLSMKQLFSKQLAPLTTFALISLVVWFFIPPHSARYGLSVFAVLLILSVFAVWKRTQQHAISQRIFLLVCGFSILMNLALRLGANGAAIPYLVGWETREHYIKKYSQGIAKGPMDLWHSGYWSTYLPPKAKSKQFPLE